MEQDKRLNWTYKDCKISPINTQHHTWGKCGEAIDFGNAIRIRYWIISFPDNSYIHCGTKSECRKYIDSNIDNIKAKGVHNRQVFKEKLN